MIANKKTLFNSLVGFASTLAVSLALAACSIEPPGRAQDEIFRVNRFEAEAAKILAETQKATEASVSLVGVYNWEYTYHIVVAYSGDIADLSLANSSLQDAGHREVLEGIKDGNTYYQLTKDLPEGRLKRSMLRAEKLATAAVPIYDPDGYLLGYLQVNWDQDPPPTLTDVESQLMLAAEELTRLAMLFSSQ
jgi:hypothetical protein